MFPRLNAEETCTEKTGLKYGFTGAGIAWVEAKSLNQFQFFEIKNRSQKKVIAIYYPGIQPTHRFNGTSKHIKNYYQLTSAI